jgi:hypothetical protein
MTGAPCKFTHVTAVIIICTAILNRSSISSCCCCCCVHYLGALQGLGAGQVKALPWGNRWRQHKKNTHQHSQDANHNRCVRCNTRMQRQCMLLLMATSELVIKQAREEGKGECVCAQSSLLAMRTCSHRHACQPLQLGRCLEGP